MDLKYLEKLSKLEIAEEDKEKFAKDFENIVEFVNEITKLDLPEEDLSLGKHIEELREDKIDEEREECDVLLNAPKKKNGCYVTPLVVE